MQYPVYGPYQAPGPRRPLWGGLSFRSYWEKRGIRQAALGVGVSFLLFYILQFGISLLLSVVLLLLGPAGEEAYALLTDPAGVYVQSVVLSALLFTLPFVIGARVSRRRVGEIIQLGRVQPSRFVPLVCIGLGMCMVGNFAVSLLGSTLSAFGMPPVQPQMEDPAGFFGLALTVLASAFLPALVEEFAFRGVVMGLLRPFGDGFAIVVSAVLFGLMHGNLVQAPFAVVVGLGLGYITVAARSMWPAIAAHFLNNLLATLFNSLAAGLTPTVFNLANGLFCLLFLAVGLIGAAVYVRKQPAAFRLHPSPCELSASGRYKAFASQPAMIVTLCLLVLSILATQFML